MDNVFVVFGGAGFVGQALIRQLRAAGITAIVVDSAVSCECGMPYFQVDISDPGSVASLADQLPDGAVFVNLAARQYHLDVPRTNRQAWFQVVNLNGACHVADLAIEKRAAGLVQFSSDMVYGMPQTVPVAESHSLHPNGAYGVSKKLMEAALTEKARRSGLGLTIFRPRLIVGPGRLGVFVKLFKLIRYHLPVPLIGAGDNYYQMVSVEDCARAVILAYKNAFPEGCFNLGSVPEHMVKQLIRDLVHHAGSHSLVVSTPVKLMHTALSGLATMGIEPLYKEQYAIADKNLILDTNRAREMLGWQPSQSDRDMIFAAYDAYLQN